MCICDVDADEPAEDVDAVCAMRAGRAPAGADTADPGGDPDVVALASDCADSLFVGESGADSGTRLLLRRFAVSLRSSSRASAGLASNDETSGEPGAGGERSGTVGRAWCGSR
jgi:hypothetical protein